MCRHVCIGDSELTACSTAVGAPLSPLAALSFRRHRWWIWIHSTIVLLWRGRVFAGTDTKHRDSDECLPARPRLDNKSSRRAGREKTERRRQQFGETGFGEEGPKQETKGLKPKDWRLGNETKHFSWNWNKSNRSSDAMISETSAKTIKVQTQRHQIRITTTNKNKE